MFRLLLFVGAFCGCSISLSPLVRRGQSTVPSKSWTTMTDKCFCPGTERKGVNFNWCPLHSSRCQSALKRWQKIGISGHSPVEWLQLPFLFWTLFQQASITHRMDGQIPQPRNMIKGSEVDPSVCIYADGFFWIERKGMGRCMLLRKSQSSDDVDHKTVWESCHLFKYITF